MSTILSEFTVIFRHKNHYFTQILLAFYYDCTGFPPPQTIVDSRQDIVSPYLVVVDKHYDNIQRI